MRGELSSQSASAGSGTAIPPVYTAWQRPAARLEEDSMVALPPYFAGVSATRVGRVEVVTADTPETVTGEVPAELVDHNVATEEHPIGLEERPIGLEERLEVVEELRMELQVGREGPEELSAEFEAHHDEVLEHHDEVEGAYAELPPTATEPPFVDVPEVFAAATTPLDEPVLPEPPRVEEPAAEIPLSGREVVSITPATTAAHDLAARLEAIARRLRTDGTAAVVEGMRGDRFDALLAGLFAGYLAARDIDS